MIKRKQDFDALIKELHFPFHNLKDLFLDLSYLDFLSPKALRSISKLMKNMA